MQGAGTKSQFLCAACRRDEEVRLQAHGTTGEDGPHGMRCATVTYEGLPGLVQQGDIVYVVRGGGDCWGGGDCCCCRCWLLLLPLLLLLLLAAAVAHCPESKGSCTVPNSWLLRFPRRRRAATWQAAQSRRAPCTWRC